MRKTDVNGQRTRGAPFLRGGHRRRGRASYLPKAGACRGGRGKGTRPRLHGESQDVYMNRTTRGLQVGIGRAGPLAPHPSDGRHRSIREFEKRGSVPPPWAGGPGVRGSHWHCQGQSRRAVGALMIVGLMVVA